MEKERLNRILADANATSEQIIEQQRLAAEAEEKAMKEAERWDGNLIKQLSCIRSLTM